MCIQDDLTCGCAKKYLGMDLSTSCYEANEYGICWGERVCLDGTLTACDAIVPAADDICNGVDDDCDGQADEDFLPAECVLENEFGICPGTTACTDGDEICEGQVPEAEVCDGADNDCDGEVDEDFPDLDDDGEADCLDDDDDGDGIPDEADNCPKVANPAQDNHDLDTQGDACDPDDDNDLVADEEDCEPFNPSIYPGAPELCDGVDQDCDGEVDDGALDTDGDGEADCIDADDDGDGVLDGDDVCPLVPDPAQLDLDSDGLGDACDDDDDGDGDPDLTDCMPLDPTVGHGLLEICDGADQDCDAAVDEGFPDLDDNGVGDACDDDKDGDLDPDDTDCAPQDPSIHHGAVEACNAVDDNCNGIIDEGYPDTDGNGQANCIDVDDDGDGVPDDEDNCPAVGNPDQADTDGDGAGNACDPDDDGDGDPDTTDCKLLDPAVNPDATEVCNGVDDDCDGLVDPEDAGGCETYYYSGDGDGFGLDLSKCLCTPLAPYLAPEAGDCNDNNAGIHPGATEFCNGMDDDCDGALDEEDAVGCTGQFVDGDGDGAGAGAALCLCGSPAGYAKNAGDCDDDDPLVSPTVLEQCNDKDDDCDDLVDEVGAVGCAPYYHDGDGDGYGILGSTKCLCQPEGSFAATVPGDCDDDADAIHPTALELCNGVDDNCNGQVDEGVKTTYYKDNDGDGYGTPNDKLDTCAAPPGYVDAGTDCNDFNPEIHPDRAEDCNGIDDDCDGVADEGIPTVAVYVDLDGDGHGAVGAVAVLDCLIDGDQVPDGFSLVADDCDDSASTVHPGAALICDGKDNDCDGVVDRYCFTSCPGGWPFQQTFPGSRPQAMPADLDGDGVYEVIVQSNFGFAILDDQGTALHDYSAPVHNFSRGRVVLADIDDYDTWSVPNQTLEVLTGNGSIPRFYKLFPDGTVTVTENAGVSIYDASRFLARDVDYDRRPEFFTTTWCNPSALIRAFRFNKAGGTIELVSSEPEPYGICAYTAGRFLGDLDGDGIPELVTGNGWAEPATPSKWGGFVLPYTFDDLSSLDMSPFCTFEDCFPTDVEGVFQGQVREMLFFVDQVRANVGYFLSKEEGQANPCAGAWRWAWDSSGEVAPQAPTQDGGLFPLYPTDVDDDGVPEQVSHVARIGLFDIDGDGFPDRVRTVGTELLLDFWDPEIGGFASNPGSSLEVSGESLRLGGLWDLNGDGRIEALVSDDQGQVFCYALGQGTWNRHSSLPPHLTPVLATNQWDNFEPNDGADLDDDGLPDQVVHVPSALTAEGNFYSYLTTAEDEDFFLVNTDWGGGLCLRSPPGRNYGVAVYSYADKINEAAGAPGQDGLPDGLVWENTSGATTKCFSGSLVYPYRYGEYRFIIRIWSLDGTSSPYWPYWLDAPK